MNGWRSGRCARGTIALGATMRTEKDEKELPETEAGEVAEEVAEVAEEADMEEEDVVVEMEAAAGTKGVAEVSIN